MRMATTTSAVQLTDEYVVSDRKSVWCEEMERVRIIPRQERMRKGYALKSAWI